MAKQPLAATTVLLRKALTMTVDEINSTIETLREVRDYKLALPVIVPAAAPTVVKKGKGKGGRPKAVAATASAAGSTGAVAGAEGEGGELPPGRQRRKRSDAGKSRGAKGAKGAEATEGATVATASAEGSNAQSSTVAEASQASQDESDNGLATSDVANPIAGLPPIRNTVLNAEERRIGQQMLDDENRANSASS